MGYRIVSNFTYYNNIAFLIENEFTIRVTRLELVSGYSQQTREEKKKREDHFIWSNTYRSSTKVPMGGGDQLKSECNYHSDNGLVKNNN